MAPKSAFPPWANPSPKRPSASWFKKAGDAVEGRRALVELETDKVTLEVPAPAAGVLSEITAKEGETVGVGALLGTIAEGSGAAAAPQPRQAAAVAARRRRRSAGRSRAPDA